MSDWTYNINPLDIHKMVFFIRRLDEVADVVGLYTILLLGFTPVMAYTILNELDRGEMVTITDNNGSVIFDIVVITPMDEVADRTYGFDLSAVS